MRGRTPSGPESVEQLPGSDKAKQRVRVILQTMTGELRVQDACAQLDVCEQRIRQLRAAMLQAAIDSVEDKPPGRPARAEEPGEVTVLRAQVAELERQLQAARLSAEIAVALPQVAVAPLGPAAGPTAPEKKNASAARDVDCRRGAGRSPRRRSPSPFTPAMPAAAQRCGRAAPAPRQAATQRLAVLAAASA